MYVHKIFRKTNISNLLIRTRTCAYQGVRNVNFSENFAYVLNGRPRAVRISFTSLVNSVGSAGKVDAWFHEWHESNFGISRVGRVDPQNIGAVKENGRVEIWCG